MTGSHLRQSTGSQASTSIQPVCVCVCGCVCKCGLGASILVTVDRLDALPDQAVVVLTLNALQDGHGTAQAGLLRPVCIQQGVVLQSPMMTPQGLQHAVAQPQELLGVMDAVPDVQHWLCRHEDV